MRWVKGKWSVLRVGFYLLGLFLPEIEFLMCVLFLIKFLLLVLCKVAWFMLKICYIN